MLHLDFTLLRRYIGLHCFSLFSLPNTKAHVRYDLVAFSVRYDLVAFSVRYDLVALFVRYNLSTSTCTISISEPHILRYLVLGELRSPST